jgi:hypothetical protein
MALLATVVIWAGCGSGSSAADGNAPSGNNAGNSGGGNSGAPAAWQEGQTELLKPAQGAMAEGILSPDGARYAVSLVALREAGKPALPQNVLTTVIIDGKADSQCSLISHLCFSPDGRHVAYLARECKAGTADKTWVVLDGKVDADVQAAGGDVRFDADDRLAPYLATRDGREVVVAGGKVAHECGGTAEAFTLSPDGGHYAYCFSKSAPPGVIVKHIVVDGREIGTVTCDQIMYMLFSPDGRRTALAAHDKAAGTLTPVIDGKADHRGGNKLTPIRFSRDSQHYAYGIGIAKDARNWENEVIVDGQRRASPQIFGNVQFAPNGDIAWPESCWDKSTGYNELAYIVQRETKTTCREIYRSTRWMVLNIDFSDDDKHTAYEAVPLTNNPGAVNRVVVVDGREDGPFEKVGQTIFSPDGARVIYEAKKGNASCVVVDGQAGPACDGVSGLAFSPDGRHLVYAAQSTSGTAWLLDGKKIGQWDKTGRPIFSSGGMMAYVASRGGTIYLVRAQIKSGS